MRKTLTLAALAAALATAGCGGSDPAEPADPAAPATTQAEAATPEPTEPAAAPDYEQCDANEWDDPYEYADWVADFIDPGLTADFRDAIDAYAEDPDDFGAELELQGLLIDVRIACREVAAPPEN